MTTTTTINTSVLMDELKERYERREFRTAIDLPTAVSLTRTRFYHAMAEKLREAGAPELKLSVFEADDAAFEAALAEARIGWRANSDSNNVYFSWQGAPAEEEKPQ